LRQSTYHSYGLNSCFFIGLKFKRYEPLNFGS
jgi:hypothetical protein